MQTSMLAEEDGTEVLVRQLYARLPPAATPIKVDWNAKAHKLSPTGSPLSAKNVTCAILLLLFRVRPARPAGPARGAPARKAPARACNPLPRAPLHAKRPHARRPLARRPHAVPA
eukprot:6842450-Prymnesium_polylepis.1